MRSPRVFLAALGSLVAVSGAIAQTEASAGRADRAKPKAVRAGSEEIGVARVTPNLVGNIERPLRYRPDHGDFVIENGAEFFNRPLYGGDTAFRVDGGDKPEFVLYLPGRGGNLRLGIRAPGGAKWLQQAAHIETRYRPGELGYEIHDPLLGSGVLEVVAVAYAATEGLGVRIEPRGVPRGVELVWAYGGANGQRGKRDGDIGTESVPISEWFQLKPEFCRGNAFELTPTGFTLRSKPATIVGLVPPGAQVRVADATHWGDITALLGTADGAKPTLPIVVGHVALESEVPRYLSLQRVVGAAQSTDADLDTYREVTAPRAGTTGGRATAAAKRPESLLLPPFSPEEVAGRFAEAEKHFATLRSRVEVETPDPFFDAAVGALNVAADAVWDAPQQGIMHGAIAWRTRLLGWRGPYLLDALGWHDRFRRNAEYWMSRQNTEPITDRVPPSDEKANLARNEAGLHTNGDMSNSHYDMNLVFVDALFRHLAWTGDLTFAREAWPVIERHLAWEKRLFRREYGPEKLPLYEAYAAIWASDDLQYSGGGAMHASAYNYLENRQAARLARLLGKDPAPYDREAELLARGMRKLLWVRAGEIESDGEPLQGWFAENKDWLGEQRVHPDAALWTFYHTVDSEVPTPQEAWLMAQELDVRIPHLPVRGPGVPAGLCTLATSDWMPYDWSINNVVMAEALHGALALWEAGRPREAWSVTKGSLLAAMYMGISPGNVGSMSYLDVYRRESQRDFADGAGVMSRTVVEGVFGIKPDALAGVLRIAPGWPAEWSHAAIRHPDLSLQFRREGDTDTYTVGQQIRSASGAGDTGQEGFPRTLAVKLIIRAVRDRVAGVTIDGRTAAWRSVEDSVGEPRIEIDAPAPVVSADRGAMTVAIRWTGSVAGAGTPVAEVAAPGTIVATGAQAAEIEASAAFQTVGQGQLRWLAPRPTGPVAARSTTAALDGLEPVDVTGATFAPVDLTAPFNDRVTQIFRNEYRSPRSPFVSLALPKQGIGGWAGGVNRTALIDDSGLRAASAAGSGVIRLPNGVPFATPADAGARNVAFTSQWDNYPRQVTVPVSGRARGVYLLLAGSTNPMQSRFENGVVVITYTDGSTARLPLVNPTNWWPIEQDYFIDDFQFRRPQPLPIRVDLATGHVRVLDAATFKGQGGNIRGGAATVLSLPLDPAKALQSVALQATANDVVIGLMAVTLVR